LFLLSSRHILEQGGSAVDAAIAIVLCEGVVLPHSLGVGGGFVATIYSKKTGKVESLIARERAPLRATQDMFVNSSITGNVSSTVLELNLPEHCYQNRCHLSRGSFRNIWILGNASKIWKASLENTL